MKKKLTLLLVLLAGAAVSPVYASPIYVSGNVGFGSSGNINFTNPGYGWNDYPPTGNTPLKPGAINVNAAAGAHLLNYRLECEMGYLKSNLDSYPYKWDIQTTYFQINGYYDFKLKVIEPYITAGIGIANNTYGYFTNAESSYYYTFTDGPCQAMTYQIGAGVAIPIQKDMMLDVRYRHFATSDFKIQYSPQTHSLSTNSVLVGVRVGI